MEEEEEEEPGGRWEKRDVGGHTRSFPAGSELCAAGVSRQPEGVTPAYSYAGNGGRRKLHESGGTRNTPTVLLRCCASSGR